MKKLVVFSGISLAMASNVYAQSSVNVYGVIDTGISHVSNANGLSNTTLDTGILSPNLIGFTGSEELGGELKAVFKLENQFAADNGKMIGGLFNHQAYVGLDSKKYGLLTFGNRDDFMFTELAVKRYGPAFRFISIQNLRQGPFAALGVPNLPGGSFDFDRVGNSQRVANSVRYDSPVMGGYSFGVLYGFGEQSGSLATGSAKSLGASYAGGPLTLTAAYTDVKYMAINNGNDGVRNWGVGFRYDISGVSLDGLYTNTKQTFTNAKIDAVEIGAAIPLAATTHFIPAYTYMKGNDVLNNNKAHQLNLTLHYTLSKRTALYLATIHQKASGSSTAQAWIPLAGGPSSSDAQHVFRIGAQHAF